MTTLVIDTGTDIIGIYSVEGNNYIPYQRNAFSRAIRRIEAADEVVTYNGKSYDLPALAGFAGRELFRTGTHTDMRSICWSDRIWGRNLYDTYGMHFTTNPVFPNTYEGSNQNDCYKTFKLWELWKQGKLKILDGHHVAN
jgi:hypothetical protein